MCGIYGYISKAPLADNIEVIKDLAELSEVRGRHATGYAALNGRFWHKKAPVPASNFNFDDLYEEIPDILIGHNRWATQGDPQDNMNNHPFVSKQFAFTHNGTLGNVGKEIKTQSKCDSERMFRFFLQKFSAYHDVVKAIEETGKKFINEAFAIALMDKQERKLYLFRNTKRPLYISIIPEMKTLFYASTKEIMSEAKAMWENLGETEDFSIRSHVVYQIDMGLKITKHEMKWHESQPPTTKVYKWDKFWYPGTSYKSKPKKVKRKNPSGVEYCNYWKCRKCGKKYMNFDYAHKHVQKAHRVFDMIEVYDAIQMPGWHSCTTPYTK